MNTGSIKNKKVTNYTYYKLSLINNSLGGGVVVGRKKIKEFVIKILCAKCSTPLYIYKKEGPGSLVKCYVEGILKDYTNGNLECPKCGQQFARLAKYHNRPAHKIIQGKVIVKGHCGK